jgi:hypothetical protein
MRIVDRLKSLFSTGAAQPSAPLELDANSEAALSQSLARLSSERPGWITMQAGRRLFSRLDDQYAFGETDDVGRANLERFARRHAVRYDFMPAEGRIYFARAGL